MTLYKHLCECFVLRNFYLKCFTCSVSLITIDWHFDDWEKRKKKYILNELYSIVAVKYKNSSISRSPTGEMKKNISFCSKEAQKSYLTISTNVVGKHLEKSVWRKFSLIYYWFLLFITHTIILETAEDIGVLLNWISNNKHLKCYCGGLHRSFYFVCIFFNILYYIIY